VGASFILFTRYKKQTVIDDCKSMLTGYFMAYNQCDYADMMLIIDDEVEQSYGENDALKQRLMARRMLLGECVRYEITEINYRKIKGEYGVNITYRAIYDKQSPVTETLMFLTFDHIPVIIGLDLGRESIVDEVVAAFFDAYHFGDFEAMTACFNPIYFEYTSPETLQSILLSIEKAAGEFQGIEPLEEFYYCHNISPQVICVYTGFYCAEYDHERMMVEIELSVQKGKIGINFLNFSPYVD
jgi:hypothetical protein